MKIKSSMTGIAKIDRQEERGGGSKTSLLRNCDPRKKVVKEIEKIFWQN